jgi:hypothetical protein
VQLTVAGTYELHRSGRLRCSGHYDLSTFQFVSHYEKQTYVREDPISICVEKIRNASRAGLAGTLSTDLHAGMIRDSYSVLLLRL